MIWLLGFSMEQLQILTQVIANFVTIIFIQYMLAVNYGTG